MRGYDITVFAVTYMGTHFYRPTNKHIYTCQ